MPAQKWPNPASLRPRDLLAGTFMVKLSTGTNNANCLRRSWLALYSMSLTCFHAARWPNVWRGFRFGDGYANNDRRGAWKRVSGGAGQFARVGVGRG